MADRVLNKKHTQRRVSSQGNMQNSSQVRKKVKKPKDGRIVKGIDYTFLVIIVIMLCFGLVMVLSSSSVDGSRLKSDSYHFLKSQLKAIGVGLCAMLIVSRIDYRKFKKWTRIFMYLSIIALILVLTPLGKTINGAQRWLFGVQPSEFVKLTVAMYFAAMIENRNGKPINHIFDVCRFAIWLLVIGVLMKFQPHLSGTLIICAIGAVVLVVGGLHPGWWFGGGIAGIIGGTLFILSSPNKIARVKNFLNPFSDSQNMGWQVVQSLYAIVTGSFWGIGLGQSRQKYYLPEPYNDFIFAIICEELGTFGALLLMGLFVWFIIRGMKIALEAPDTFGTLLVMGIISQVAIQGLFNIAVATSSVPNTGVSLPFFSYGGSAVAILLLEMGFVLSVSRYSRKSDAM